MDFNLNSAGLTEDSVAILDRGCSFTGKLAFEGTLHLAGEFKGEIFTYGTLIVDEGAKVEARIEAEYVIIRGHVHGDIIAKKSVTMYPPATFKGSVESLTLSIHEGVVFQGSSHMS